MCFLCQLKHESLALRVKTKSNGTNTSSLTWVTKTSGIHLQDEPWSSLIVCARMLCVCYSLKLASVSFITTVTSAGSRLHSVSVKRKSLPVWGGRGGILDFTAQSHLNHCEAAHWVNRITSPSEMCRTYCYLTGMFVLPLRSFLF